MVVGQVNVDEARQIFAGIDEIAADIADELRGAELIWDVGVVAGIFPIRVAIERRWHRDVGEKSRAGGL